jgi:hypothetical protein
MPAILPRSPKPLKTAAPLMTVADWNVCLAGFWVPRYLGCPRAVFSETSIMSCA